MLIINADDWGKDKNTTDRIDTCFKNQRVSSTTAMMFMQDSERAAALALKKNYDVGLHLNFTDPFTGDHVDSVLTDCQRILANFFTSNKYARVLYNMLIIKQLEYSFRAQYVEFFRLYGLPPTHIDGHHHIHLCSNLIWSKLLPEGIKVRRSINNRNSSFVNRFYRWLIDLKLLKKYRSTDFFYLIDFSSDEDCLIETIDQSRKHDVELVVHPGRKEEYDFLMSDAFFQIIANVDKGSYRNLK